MADKNELVLAVPTALLRPLLIRRGLITEHTDELLELIAEKRVFLPRAEAECDSSHRQIIPYVALTRGGEVFATRRLKSGTEARLHGLISLGIGGHIDKIRDGDDSGTVMRALRRELREEVDAPGADLSNLRFCGFINDDSNEVGSVHLGLFCTLEVTGDVFVRETHKLSGHWLRRAELSALAGEMETWSALIVPELL
jgi:predicted NUDIX family phosphoesterase